MREFRLLRVDLSTETIDSMYLDEQLNMKRHKISREVLI